MFISMKMDVFGNENCCELLDGRNVRNISMKMDVFGMKPIFLPSPHPPIKINQNNLLKNDE